MGRSRRSRGMGGVGSTTCATAPYSLDTINCDRFIRPPYNLASRQWAGSQLGFILNRCCADWKGTERRRFFGDMCLKVDSRFSQVQTPGCTLWCYGNAREFDGRPIVVRFGYRPAARTVRHAPSPKGLLIRSH